MHNFRELKIWQKSRKLVKDVYVQTNQFPKEEIYVLTSQIRRAAISIPANIAEGCGRGTDKDFSRFLDISNGSAFELEALLLLSSDLDFISENEANQLVTKLHEIEKMIFNLKSRIN